MVAIEGIERLETIGGLGDDVQIRLVADDVRDARPHQHVIVNHQDACARDCRHGRCSPQISTAAEARFATEDRRLAGAMQLSESAVTSDMMSRRTHPWPCGLLLSFLPSPLSNWGP
jgi:hypothetical protein